jgi:predicted helicase
LWGDRERKYEWLFGHSVSDTEWQDLDVAEPFYFFEPFDMSGSDDYYRWRPINEIMPVNVTGVITARDGFVIDNDRKSILDRVHTFLDEQLSDDQVRECLNLSENYAWRVSSARKELSAACEDAPVEDLVASILYRPFDERFILWHSSVVWRIRSNVMRHMTTGENVGLIYMRQVAQGDEYTHFGVSRIPVDNRAFYSNRGIMSFSPLYLYTGADALFHRWPGGKDGRRPNLSPEFVHTIEQATGLAFQSDGCGNLGKTFGPEDVLAYMYAVFHSPAYRRLYEPLLKRDFPRVPLPGSSDTYVVLALLGHEMLVLHQLESPILDSHITVTTGPGQFEVEKVSYSDEIVWIDKAKTRGFKGVPEEVWNFHVGGYQICHKWLKDRQAKGGKNPRSGRILTEDDIDHYQKIIVALSETIRIMKEIDEVIEEHGGWPDAFNTSAELYDLFEVPPEEDSNQTKLDLF